MNPSVMRFAAMGLFMICAFWVQGKEIEPFRHVVVSLSEGVQDLGNGTYSLPDPYVRIVFRESPNDNSSRRTIYDSFDAKDPVFQRLCGEMPSEVETILRGAGCSVRELTTGSFEPVAFGNAQAFGTMFSFKGENERLSGIVRVVNNYDVQYVVVAYGSCPAYQLRNSFNQVRNTIRFEDRSSSAAKPRTCLKITEKDRINTLTTAIQQLSETVTAETSHPNADVEGAVPNHGFPGKDVPFHGQTGKLTWDSPAFSRYSPLHGDPWTRLPSPPREDEKVRCSSCKAVTDKKTSQEATIYGFIYLCEKCRYKRRCRFCEMPADFQFQNGGGYSCDNCRSQWVFRKDQLSLVQNIFQRVERLLPGGELCEIEFCPCPLIPGANGTLGLWSSGSEGHCVIYYLDYLPYDILVDTLAHEIGHAWAYHNLDPSLVKTQTQKEGFAEWFASLVDEDFGLTKIIEGKALRADYEYGEGFRSMRGYFGGNNVPSQPGFH